MIRWHGRRADSPAMHLLERGEEDVNSVYGTAGTKAPR